MGYIREFRDLKTICMDNGVFDSVLFQTLVGISPEFRDTMQMKHGSDSISKESELFDLWFPVACRYGDKISPRFILGMASLIAYRRDLCIQFLGSTSVYPLDEQTFWTVTKSLYDHFSKRFYCSNIGKYIQCEIVV